MIFKKRVFADTILYSACSCDILALEDNDGVGNPWAPFFKVSLHTKAISDTWKVTLKSLSRGQMDLWPTASEVTSISWFIGRVSVRHWSLLLQNAVQFVLLVYQQ